MRRDDYQYFKVLNKDQTENVLNQLREQFGVEKIPGILIMKGAERIFLYQGTLTEKDIRKLEEIIPIERIGVYFAKEQNDEIRLSIEGVHLLRDQIKKGIFDITEEQMHEWMYGSELLINTGYRQFIILRYNGNLLGCGKASEQKVSNFIPKSRRLKFKN